MGQLLQCLLEMGTLLTSPHHHHPLHTHTIHHTQLPSLRRAFVRYTGITGALDCALVNNLSLILLSVSGNDLTGTVPPCFLNDPTLEEVYLSHTALTGPLPDVVPPTSPLRTVFAVGLGGEAPALSGE